MSTAVVVEELLALGARELVRIGTCGSLDPELRLGDLVVARATLARDGASAALGAGDRVLADAQLSDALGEGADAVGLVASSDLFYDERPGVAAAWRGEGALAVEMESAVLFRLAELRGARAACLLAVADLLDASDAEAPVRHRARIARDELETAGLRLGDVAAAALVGRAGES